MALTVFGLNHNSAPLTTLEKTAIAERSLPHALADFKANVRADEVVILSTCNRCEIYSVPRQDGDEDEIAAWLCSYCGVGKAALNGCCFSYRDKAAIRHLMRVASSVDSMIVGEPQILGQVKSAYRAALDAGVSGAVLSRLFENSISIAKKVRSETGLGKHPVSYVSAAIKACRRLFENLSNKHVLLIGTGEMTDLAARHFKSQRVASLTISGRASDKARALAAEHGGKTVAFESIGEVLHGCDIVVSCTAATFPILDKDTVAAALKVRKHSPVCIVDIALPRDVDAAVEELPDVYLYTLESLAEIVDDNKQTRLAAAEQAEILIRGKVDEYLRWSDSHKAAELVADLLEEADGVRAQTLEKALKALRSGKPPEEALTQLASSLTGKLTHPMLETLKQAAAQGHFELLEAAARRLGRASDKNQDKNPSKDSNNEPGAPK